MAAPRNFLSHVFIISFVVALHSIEVKCDSLANNPITIRSTEAFFISLNYKWFPEFHIGDELEYSASLQDMPDLPNWMFMRHPPNRSEAYLYGAAPESADINIDLIALNKHTYETSLKVLKLRVEPRSVVAGPEVEMKFLNMNVEDVFRSDRLKRLVDIFKTDLWKESGDVYVTKVVSSLDVGGRLPLNPNEKEGVVVRVGGPSQFSQDLEDLDREVIPLRNRSPCPKNFKKTSAERLFRSRNFITDWCSFRLVPDKSMHSHDSNGGHSQHSSSISLSSHDFNPQADQLPRRDFVFDFVVSIIVPIAVVGILSTSLTCIMCCSKEASEPKDESSSMHLDHYKVTQKENDPNGRSTDKTDGLGATATVSFPSRAASPSLNTPKGTLIRPSSRAGTLRSYTQPDPPPYVSNSLNSRRNILT